MSNLLVINNNGAPVIEKSGIFNQFADWNIFFLNGKDSSQNAINHYILHDNIHFLLFSEELNQKAIQTLTQTHQRFPLLTIIYYYTQMKDEEFARLYEAGINYCIVGDARQINLIKTLRQLWQNHWRRIPPYLLPRQRELLPPQAQDILHIIETETLKNFTATSFAKYLNISESQFRNDFRTYFAESFRDFKQNLLRHYETLLLLEKDLKPHQVYHILNYKNISAFSRSFKSRHGTSWQQLIRQTAKQQNSEGLI